MVNKLLNFIHFYLSCKGYIWPQSQWLNSPRVCKISWPRQFALSIVQGYMIWHFWKKDKSGLFKNKNIFSSWKSWYNLARWKTNFHILFYSTLAKKKQLKTYLVLFWDNAEYLGLYLACLAHNSIFCCRVSIIQKINNVLK